MTAAILIFAFTLALLLTGSPERPANDPPGIGGPGSDQGK